MCKFTEYRIVHDRGKYYIEIPTWYFFWKRLSELKKEEQFDRYIAYEYTYEFTCKDDAVIFAEDTKFKVIKEVK